MNYLPPLRNHQQMVRVIQNKADSSQSYELGNAFGDTDPNDPLSSTERVMQTLDSMNLPSSSIRRSGATRHGGTLPTRAASSHYHQLNDSTRGYFNGTHGGQTLSRLDNEPGTKVRTSLTPSADSKLFYHHAHHQNPHHSVHKHQHHHASHG